MRVLAFLLVMLIGALISTFVRAEECHKLDDTLTQLQQFDAKMRSLMEEAGAVLFDNHGKWPVQGQQPS